MSELRSYGDPCGIARALDRIGERWALLVVRELLLGPKRFGDLASGLPGVSPNVLAQRLRELEQAGVVTRKKLPPPASVWVYALTEWGQELEAVLLALGRWGSRAASPRAAELGEDALLIALKTQFDPAAAGSFRTCIALQLGDQHLQAVVADGRFELRRADTDVADARVDTEATTLRALVFGNLSLAAALRAGDITLQGDRQAVKRFLRLFPRPTPVAAA